MASSALQPLLFVPVAGDAPAAEGAGSPSEGRECASTDGGNNASADINRHDAPDADRALRPGGADDHGSFGIRREGSYETLLRTSTSAHPSGPGAAGLLALTSNKPCRFAGTGDAPNT